jgi:3-hydroxyacyl-CoA dehydrogenase/enoyl-CoA hydratase/3-hydroxybutyryl-CoA epimerase/3-hydroxyacyl-CoA dehydrogenase/enoyl-CoA hydratase/3-hydroxybutyryl-CoA epimerase/enoyl-CoA isomerase
VEIIRGPQTTDATIATLVAHVKSAGRLPIVVSDGPGFLVNRLLLPYMNEALELLREGTPVEVIERAAVEFGMATGPLHLLDQIGLDTSLRGGLVLFQAFSDRIAGSPLLVAMVKAGRLGCKTGGGFFSGVSDATAIDQPLAPAAAEILAPWMDRQHPSAAEMVTGRLFLTMLLEATRILEEGRVRNPRDIDLGVLFGLGFPAERGGLLRWAPGPGRRLGSWKWPLAAAVFTRTACRPERSACHCGRPTSESAYCDRLCLARIIHDCHPERSEESLLPPR